MKYSVWFRRESDNRIPECAILDRDYEYLGEVEATTKGDIYFSLKNNDDPDMTIPRSLQAGDVVMDAVGEHWVWTERGMWAIVMVINDSGYVRSDEDEEDY